MYYLKDFCFLCLSNHDNLSNITAESIESKVKRDKLNCFLPEFLFVPSNVAKYICSACSGSLNNAYTFKQKCLDNINNYNEYVQKLTQMNDSYRNLSVVTQQVQEKGYELIKESCENSDVIEEPNIKAEIVENEKIVIKEELLEVNNLEEDPLELSDTDLIAENSSNEITDMSQVYTITGLINYEHCYSKTVKIIADDPPSTSYNILYKCRHCDKQFKNNTILMFHQRSHIEEKPYKCSVCKRNFKIKQSAENCERKHAGKLSYKCNTCSRRFCSQNSWKIHLRSHGKTFECFMCRIKFDTSLSLSLHMKKHNLRTKYRTFTFPVVS